MHQHVQTDWIKPLGLRRAFLVQENIMKPNIKSNVTAAILIVVLSFFGVQSSQAEPKPTHVIVDNAVANPAQVRDVDNPARQPFSGSQNATFQPGSRDAIFSVPPPPSGKQLVIESVTVNALIPTGQNLWSASLNHNPLIIVPQGDVGTGFDAFTASQQVRLYLAAGDSITFIVSRNSTTGSGVVGGTVSGYLVDVP